MCVWVCVLWVAPVLVMVGRVAFRIYWKVLSYYNNHEIKVHLKFIELFYGGIIGCDLMTITLATWQPCGCYATWQSCGCYTITGILGVLSHGSHVDIRHHMRAMLITMSHGSHVDTWCHMTTGHLTVVCTQSLIIIPHKRERLHMEDFKTTIYSLISTYTTWAWTYIYQL